MAHSFWSCHIYKLSFSVDKWAKWPPRTMDKNANFFMLISLSLKQCQNIVFMPTEDTACGNKYVGLLRLSTIKE